VANGKSILAAEKQAKEEEKAERKAYTLEKEMPSDVCNLFVADVKSGLSQIADSSVDFIITDPPYPKEYLPLYEDLSALADRVLKPNGSLIVMCGQSYLPEVINNLCAHMKYHWTMAYCTPGGQSPQLFHKKVNTFWKPVLWFVKNEYKGDWVGDVLKSDVNDNDKRFHEWGQSFSGMKDIVERFTNPNETILDPFLGGGTTGAVAVTMGRKFIGVDIDEKNVKTSKERIEVLYNECAK
jgi:site-specific DNA-methyltransferase (adenine-specific)